MFSVYYFRAECFRVFGLFFFGVEGLTDRFWRTRASSWAAFAGPKRSEYAMNSGEPLQGGWGLGCACWGGGGCMLFIGCAC